jgi:histidinol-phosphate aminotransferase
VSDVLDLARPEIVALKAYAHAAWLPGLTRLHANEAPWRPSGDSSALGLNRYPEPQPAALIASLGALYQVPATQVLATRGADEAIDLLARIFLRAGVDSILQCAPTFGMYQVAARIQGAAVIELPLDREQGWNIDARSLLAAWRPGIKLIFLCSPNNPTANLLDAGMLEAVCAGLQGRAMVVIDEAYIEWSESPSLATWLDRFQNLVILRTLSKAHALAGARLGAMLAAPELIDMAKRVIPPYALTQSTIEAVLRALQPAQLADSKLRRDHLLAEREYLRHGLETSPLVAKVWPSSANFLLVDCHDVERFMQQSMAGGTIVRDLRAYPALPHSVRVSVGAHEENMALLASVGHS